MKRIITALAGAGVVLMTLSGCASVDLLGITQSRAALDAAERASDTGAEPIEETAEAGASPEPTATAEPEPESVVSATTTPSGDLANGTASHRIPAGSGTITLDYWTNQNPADWTSDKTVPVYLNVTIGDAGPRAVYSVSWFRASVAGTPVIEDAGTYQITPPFSYFTTVVLPASEEPGVQLLVEFEIAMETTEGSGEFTKIRLADALNIDFVAPGTTKSATSAQAAAAAAD